MASSTTTFSFGRKISRPQPDSPYARASAAWDERIGTARVQAHHWRMAAILSITLALIATAGAMVMSIKKQVATYVVEIDKLGMPARITLADDVYKPQPAQVGYFVGEMVRLVRERPLDPVVMRQNWTRAYQFLAGSAVNAMNAYAASDNGLETTPSRGAMARTVQISNVLQKSNDSYQVRWLETSYANGVRRSEDSYTGLFRVKLIPPRDEQDVFKNPLGVYIIEFTWSREFAGPVTTEDMPSSNK